jgi:hypothetical protein
VKPLGSEAPVVSAINPQPETRVDNMDTYTKESSSSEKRNLDIFLDSSYNTLINQESIKKQVNMKKEIIFVDSPCGSGKTYSMLKSIGKQKAAASQEVNLIVVPTINLSNEHAKHLKSHGINHVEVNSRNVAKEDERNTKTRIHDAINGAFNTNQNITIIITLNSFWEIDHLGYMKKSIEKVNLWCDEIPIIEESIPLCIPWNFHLLTSLFEIDTSEDNATLSKIKFSHDGGQKRAADIVKKNKTAKDDFFDKIATLSVKLARGDDIWVNTEIWNRLAKGGVMEDGKMSPEERAFGNPKNTMNFVIFRNPNQFLAYKKCTIVGANFKNSILYQHYTSKHQIKFTPDHEIMNNLRYQKHENGDLLTVIYMQDDNLSQYCLKKIDENDKLVIQSYMNTINNDIISRGLKKERVLCLGNQKLMNMCDVPVTFDVVSSACHGLNKYSDHSIAIAALSANRNPHHSRGLTAMGYDDKLQQLSLAIETSYQGIMRTSLRNPNSKKKVYVYVIDFQSARFLADIFPGCTIQKMGKDIKYKSVSKLVQAKPEPEKLNFSLPANDDANAALSNFLKMKDSSKPNSQAASEAARSAAASHVSFLESLYDTTDFQQVKIQTENLFEELKKFNDGDFIAKEDRILFNFFEYGKIDGTVSRKKDNALTANGLIFDIDGGDISPEMFKEMFDEVIQGEYLIYGTEKWNSGLNNYRVVIPSKVPMDMETYDRCFMKVVNDLEKKSFSTVPQGESEEEYRKRYIKRKISGIDLSKKNASSAFFVPCNSTLFEIQNSNSSEAGSKEFNPHQFIRFETVRIEEPKTELIPIMKSRKATSIKKAAKQAKQIEKIKDIIKNMVPGNRSYLACVVGGAVKYIKDENMKHELLRAAKETGIDDQAYKMMIKYSKS